MLVKLTNIIRRVTCYNTTDATACSRLTDSMCARIHQVPWAADTWPGFRGVGQGQVRSVFKGFTRLCGTWWNYKQVQETSVICLPVGDGINNELSRGHCGLFIKPVFIFRTIFTKLRCVFWRNFIPIMYISCIIFTS